MTLIELNLSPIEHFENNLDIFINNWAIFDDTKLIMLQNALWRMERPYRERLLNVNIIDQSQNLPSAPPSQTWHNKRPLKSKQDEDLSKALSSFVDQVLHLYREQNKRLLTYCTENEHLQIDD